MKLLYCLICCIALSSCSHEVTRGHILHAKHLSLLKKNLHKDEVIKDLGSPTLMSCYLDNRWYYVSRVTKHKNIGQPALLLQKLLVVEFDDKDRLQDFWMKEESNLSAIPIISDTTIVEGTDTNIFWQFMKNLGRFNTPKKEKNNKKKS